jgi:signal transduction histidine kinase
MQKLRTWFRNLHLPMKVFLVFAPLFSLAVAAIVYLNYTYQEEQTLQQAQGSAVAQALTIRESLVEMMTENERVDDAYLQRITKIGDVQTLEVLFYLDSLRLADDLQTDERLARLRTREERVMKQAPPFVQRVFMSGQAEWYLTCATNQHADRSLSTFKRDRPFLFSDCDQLEAVIPFPAERKCLQCHNVQLGHVLGAVYVKVPLAKTTEALKANAYRSFMVFAVFTVIALGIGMFVFRQYVSRPLSRLVAATEAIGRGELDHVIQTDDARDEFGKVADSFNHMQERLKAIQNELILKERLSLVGQMASSIVHDLRGPMTAIGVAIDMLKDGASSETKRKELHTKVQAALDRMNGMMQELLDYSRGQITLNFAPCDIGKFVEEIVAMMKPYLDGKKISFEVNRQFDGVVHIDEPRLHRALLDILHNAEDAMEEGGTIRFDIIPDGEYVLFRIQNQGKGIPPEVKDRIFEPFVTFGKQRGTGLGLAIVKKVIDQHGGKIRFDSVPGVGTTFYVHIPAVVIG